MPPKQASQDLYFAFLRAINVGGRRVKKEALCAPFVELGLEDVSSFIASGNVVFSGPKGAEAKLEKEIEAALESSLGFEVVTFLRTPAEVRKILKQKPFPSVKARPDDLHSVGFLKKAPSKKVATELAALSNDKDLVAIKGRELHWLRRVPFASSTVAGGQLEKGLRGPTTVRNLSTLERMLAKYTD